LASEKRGEGFSGPNRAGNLFSSGRGLQREFARRVDVRKKIIDFAKQGTNKSYPSYTIPVIPT